MPSDGQLALKAVKQEPDYCLQSDRAPPRRSLPRPSLVATSTHPAAVRRSTGTCAGSLAGFSPPSEPARAASPGWKGPGRLGR